MEAIAQQWEAKARLDAARARSRQTETSQAAPRSPTEDPKGEGVRLLLDHATFEGGLTGVGLLLSGAILNLRTLGTLFKKTRLGVVRFMARNLFEMLPNASKMRPFTFTPTLGVITTGLVDVVIGVAVVLIFVAAFIPMYIISNPIQAVRIFGWAVVSIFI